MADEAEVLGELQRLRVRVPQVAGHSRPASTDSCSPRTPPGVEPEGVAARPAAALGVAQRLADATAQGAFRELLVRGTDGYVATYAAGHGRPHAARGGPGHRRPAPSGGRAGPAPGSASPSTRRPRTAPSRSCAPAAGPCARTTPDPEGELLRPHPGPSSRRPTCSPERPVDPTEHHGITNRNSRRNSNSSNWKGSHHGQHRDRSQGRPLASIEGASAAALVDYTSGMALGTIGGSKSFDLEVAAAGNTDVVRSKLRTMEHLGLKDDRGHPDHARHAVPP